MRNLTNAIVRLCLERESLLGALQAAYEMENRTLTNDEWREAARKMPLEKIRDILVKFDSFVVEQKTQDAFIKWLERGRDVINLISTNKAFKSQINLKSLKKMMTYHIKEGDIDSEAQICAGIPYLREDFPELTKKWALQAKKLAIARGNIEIALKAAELSDALNEEEIKDLLTEHIEKLIAISIAEKSNSGKSQEALTECKDILKLFKIVPADKQAIYEKIRQFIFSC